MAVKDLVTDRFAIYLGDCCKVLPNLPDESIHLGIHSPPFANLYSYSDSDSDLGNCSSYEEFFTHYEFVVKELYRLSMPGRITAIHCMDIPTHASKQGYIGLEDFPGDIIKLFKKCGFIFHARVCVWKDPLMAAVRTHAIGLAHKQIVKDSAMCRTGIPDYVLAFRKPGENPEPIAHPMGLTEYPGSTAIPHNLEKYLGHLDPKTNKRSHWVWQKIASPVWMDIRQTKLLPYKNAKDPDDEKHCCPLQTDVIERCLILWSNPGDKVLTPFMGIGSEVAWAVKKGRRGIGVELKPSYFRMAKKNILAMIRTKEGKE